jgi:acyl-CoA synthetase (AMP-forming)/AMP-acid ligase II
VDPDIYVTGDGAKRDADGFFWLLGRVDDVLNVAGHRIGTMEVESALVDHPSVAEAAVVGRPHELKGQAVAAFVTLKEGQKGGESLVERSKGSRGPQDWRHRAARRHHLRGRPAQDAVGQDHATSVARYCRGQGAGGYDDVG